LRHTLAGQANLLAAAVARHFPAATRLARPQGGYFLWLELPPQVDTLRLHQQALQHGISLAPGPIFSAQREFTHALRLNFGHPAAARQETAMATLGALIAEQMAEGPGQPSTESSQPGTSGG
jgi:DNA-binding transcriptional MocR family regulator